MRASRSNTGLNRRTSPFSAGSSSSSRHEIIDLQSIDGFEFEQLCARIFEKADWGKVELLGGIADGGRDIIITATDGSKTVVECKHYTKSTVGRPIIQKLHSAVVTTYARKGILINTGKFTAEAITHAKMLTKQHHPIELYDLQRFAEVADSVGIRFGNNAPVLTYPIRDAGNLARMILQKASMKSHPNRAEDMFATSVDTIKLHACWLVNATIQQDFKTSVGVIHSINENGVSYIFSDASGNMLDSFNDEPLDEVSTSLDDSVISAGKFQYGTKEIRDVMTDGLISEYTKTVKYAARNNRVYEKQCVPIKKNVRLNHIQKVYLPAYSMTFRALEHKYSLKAVTKNTGIQIQDDGLLWCVICKSAAPDALLCNECGNIVHRGKPHGFECHQCEKTVCRMCVHHTRRLLFFKRHFCHKCAPENGKMYED